MTDYSKIEMNGQIYSVIYEHKKHATFASTYVDGEKITKHGTDEQAAFWALNQAVYQKLNFFLGTPK